MGWRGGYNVPALPSNNMVERKPHKQDPGNACCNTHSPHFYSSVLCSNMPQIQDF